MVVDKRRYKSIDECREYVRKRAEDYNNHYHSDVSCCTPNVRLSCKNQEQLDRRSATLKKLLIEVLSVGLVIEQELSTC